ncbi:hypothetical protein BN2476_650099 [Paraburkholderia piptadeniae]|uniref:Uncharacterized protein n=1 Tax=Paraburkholderia piptadeniae TaxID=1701573 RepID=A0A1N7SN62_9BURK|nr:AraC family transcriptional regulator [Paraburkholderia piptadeniae]SIT48878.1 hypothetical protein BN2476_650099 [Paraburkholderia piptadeniae]
MGENLNPVRAGRGVQMWAWTIFDEAADYEYVVVIDGLLHSGSATLEYLSKAALSGKTLERLFSTEAGRNPAAYGRQIRVRVAAWLLRRYEKASITLQTRAGSRMRLTWDESSSASLA